MAGEVCPFEQVRSSVDPKGQGHLVGCGDLLVLRGELKIRRFEAGVEFDGAGRQSIVMGAEYSALLELVACCGVSLDAPGRELEAWREDQEEMRATARDAWNDFDIVASTATGMPIDRHSLARSMRKLCKRTGITPHVTPYELRHTAISLQADAGRSSWQIADWAGTSEAMISHVYRHRLRRVAELSPVDGLHDLGR